MLNLTLPTYFDPEELGCLSYAAWVMSWILVHIIAERLPLYD